MNQKKSKKRLIDRLLSKNDKKICIFDVGALDGVKEPWSFLAEYTDAITSEPLESYGKKKFGIGGSSRTAPFFVTKKPDGSSILCPNKTLLEKYCGASRFDVIEVTEIELATLDEVLKKKQVNELHFLKLDTQGSEYEIVNSSLKSLSTVIGIDIEVNILERYQEQHGFLEVFSLLIENGFELFDFQRRYAKRMGLEIVGYPQGQLTHGTALFFRSPESLVVRLEAMGQAERVQNIRIATAVYVAYGYLDTAAVFLRMCAEKGWDAEAGEISSAIVKSGSWKFSLSSLPGSARIAELLRRLYMLFQKSSHAGISGDRWLGPN